MKQLLLIFLISIPTFIFSQFTFSPETQISDNTTGYGRPRMAITALVIGISQLFGSGN